MCEFNREYLLALRPKYDQNLCITDTFVAAQGKAKAKESLSTTNTHLVAYCRGGEGVLGRCVTDDKRRPRGCVRRHR